MRMKFMRILPETRASTRWPLLSSTRKKALGSGSTTVPSTSIASSLVDPIFSTRSAFFFFLSERLYPPGRLCGAKLFPLLDERQAGERLVQRLRVAQGQHIEAFLRHRYGMLEMRRKPSVGGDHRPLVRLRANLPRTGVDHRLDREHHAGFEDGSIACATVIRHRRVFVQVRADTVAHERADDRKTFRLDIALHRVADV